MPPHHIKRIACCQDCWKNVKWLRQLMRLIPMFCLGLREFAKNKFYPIFFEKHQAHESIDGMNCFTCPCKVSRGFSRKVRTHVVYVHWIWNKSSSWCWRMDVLVSGCWSLKQQKSSDLQNQKQMEFSFFLSCSFPPAIQEPVCMRLLLLLLSKKIQSNVLHSSWQLGHVSRVELFVIGH